MNFCDQFWGIDGKDSDKTIGPDSTWDMVEFVHRTSRMLAMGTDWAVDIVEVSIGSETVERKAINGGHWRHYSKLICGRDREECNPVRGKIVGVSWRDN